MLKPLPKERKFSGIEQVQMLTQTAEREKEIHRLEHELNASKIACQSAHQELQKEREIIEQLKEKNQTLDNELFQQIFDNIKMQNEITKLRSALNFYADPKNYERITISLKTAKVLLDDGEFARYVLGGSNE